MHFITGGAFNGKRAWVKENKECSDWISAYDQRRFPEDLGVTTGEIVVLEGLENWTKELSQKMNVTEARGFLKRILANWQEWEKVESGRELILIGTDITKGIVPMEEADRNWRDLTGWFYQDIVRSCKRVDVIWYGLNQQIKGEM